MTDDEKLQVSEAKFRSVVESTPDGLVIVDRDSRILLVNRRVEEMFGYRREELLGQPVDILVPERLRERHIKGRKSYYLSPRALRMEEKGVALFGRRKDGSEFPVDIALSPVETEEGVHVISLIRDITECRRAGR